MTDSHKNPTEGATCLSCWDDIDGTIYVEYKSSDNSEWFPSGFCENCVKHLLDNQWELYTSALAKTTCKAEQRRLLKMGPPINIKDTTALPCPDGGEVFALWYMSDTSEHSAKLKGSLVGEERTKYWNEQSAFYIQDEPEEEKKEGDKNTNATEGAEATADEEESDL